LVLKKLKIVAIGLFTKNVFPGGGSKSWKLLWEKRRRTKTNDVKRPLLKMLQDVLCEQALIIIIASVVLQNVPFEIQGTRVLRVFYTLWYSNGLGWWHLKRDGIKNNKFP
jgi:hypothetical protein